MLVEWTLSSLPASGHGASLPSSAGPRSLDAATELFIVQGPNFTTSDLASAAGVSEGTIFRYFTDKPTLVAECRRCAIGLDELVPEIRAAAQLPTFREQVLAAVRGCSTTGSSR